ncbi:MAG: M15 family metallopeptidase [Epsilonproteobacteria bacterium]|nr:M15 family metallopeptidase [Campylobacterota bacterium]
MKRYLLLLFVFVSLSISASGKYKYRANLVEVTSVNKNIRVDVRYATKDNFTGEKVYPIARCLLDKGAAEKLNAVQKELETKGFGLKVWDAYRPFSCQQRLWDAAHRNGKEKYVANPKMGGKHTRGVTVDITLVTFPGGKDVEMPTEFDNFTQRAHRSASVGISKKALEHRQLLEDVMVKHGFDPLPHEWWHFDLKGFEEYEPLDIGLEDVAI